MGEILIDVKAQIQLSVMARQTQRSKSWQDLENEEWEHHCFNEQMKHLKQEKHIIS